MATSNCRWFPVAVDKVPSYFITEVNKLNFANLVKVTDFAAGPLSEAELTLAVNALTTDIVAQGEDVEDAAALVTQSAFYIGQEGGNYYAFFDTPSGVFVYKEKCGAMAQLPYIIGGAALLGLGGFAWGYSRKAKGGGVPAYALMGAAVGVLVGAGAGYGLAALATPKYMKNVAGMGLISTQFSRRRVVRK
jgi:hypothetical protein